MIDDTLTADERQTLEAFVREKREEEMANARKLFEGTPRRLRIARAYGEIVSEWKETKALMLASLASGAFPAGTRAALYRAIIEAHDRIVEDKLHFTQLRFEMTFGVSIFKYLRSDVPTSGQ